jgi:hypothetical protein
MLALVLCTCALPIARSASTYELDLNSFVDLGFTTSGGSFEFTYNLTSGPAVPGVGSSFTTTFEFGAFSNSYPLYESTFGVRSYPTFGLTGFGPNLDVDSMFANRPTNNRQVEAFVPGIDPIADLIGLVNGGAIDAQGTATVTMSPPPAVAGWPIIDYSIFVASSALVTLTDNLGGGVRSSPVGFGNYPISTTSVIGQPWERTLLFASYGDGNIADADHANDISGDIEHDTPILVSSSVTYIPEPSVVLGSVWGLALLLGRRARRSA